MILVDTSVWIEFLNGTKSKHHLLLKQMIQDGVILFTTDIIIMEILQGIKNDQHYIELQQYYSQLPCLPLTDQQTYIKAAEIYRLCRKNGITIRSSIDCLIAQLALENQISILHNDRDYDQIKVYYPELKIVTIK